MKHSVHRKDSRRRAPAARRCWPRVTRFGNALDPDSGVFTRMAMSMPDFHAGHGLSRERKRTLHATRAGLCKAFGGS
jgi:hypothetical protein